MSDASRGTAEEGARTRVIDVRLLLPALCLWLGAFVALNVLSYAPSSKQLLWCGSVAIFAALLGLRRRIGRVGLLAVCALVVGIVAASLRIVVIDGEVISDLVNDRAYIRAQIVVSSDPLLREGSVSGDHRTPQMETARATLVALSARGRTWTTSLPIGLRWTPGLVADRDVAPTSGWEVAGRLAPAAPGSGRAGVLDLTEARLIEAPSPVGSATELLRSGLRDAAVGLPDDAAGLLPGLAVGDTSRLDSALVSDMRTAGLTHLTAVSGSNVAMIVLVVLALARTLRVRGRWQFLVGVLAILGFVALVRPDPSVVRAATMGVIALVPMLFGGRVNATASLCAAVFLLVLIDPWLAVSYGFGLSVLATAGLIVGSVRLTRMLRERLPPGLPSWFVEASAVTLCAQVAVAPLLAAMGGSLGPAAVPANVLASFAVAPATALGVLSALISAVSPGAAHVVAWVAAIPTEWIAQVARTCAGMPGGQWTVPSGTLGAVTVLVVIGAATTAWQLRSQVGQHSAKVYARLATRPRSAVTAALLTLVVVYVGPAHRGVSGWPATGWVMVACDVGQGDAIVLRVADAEAVVVDAGPDPRAVDRCLSDLGIRAVPLLVLTHFHADHVEGVPGVLHNREVGEIEVSPLSEPVDGVRRVLSWARDAGVPTRVATADETGAIGDLRWKVLWPKRLIRGQGSDPNNASIVMFVRSSGLRILLTGDVEPAAQLALRREFGAVVELSNLDVVKVPHHGSRHQDPVSASWWRPAVAIISVGAGNDYGHPAQETIQAYKSVGAVVVRTDRQADIAVVHDDQGSRIVTRG